MATYQITAPDGNKYRLTGPDNASQQDLINALLTQHPEAGQPLAPPKEGIMAALTGGAKRLGSTIETGLESLIDPELAAKRGAARQEEIGQQYAPGASLEKVKQAYEQRGLFPAAYEAVSQIPSALAEQAPQIASALGGARAGATVGSAFGPTGALVGGIGGAFAPSLMQLYGANLERQSQEKVPEISRAKAIGAAVPGAALEVASTFVPLGRNLIGKLLGPEAEKALARGTSESIEAAAKETLAKSLAKGAVHGAIAEIPTEVTQQMLERWQAGLPLTTPDALAEYGESAYGAAMVGTPFGAVARGMGRPAARAEYANQLQVEQLKAQQELEKQKADALREQQEQRQKTESQLGVPVSGENVSNVLMLPAPAKESEVEKDPLQNPIGNIAEKELGSKLVSDIKTYRKDNNLPPLKSYSIEDIKDAVSDRSPEEQEGIINRILAFKTNHQGQEYTPQNILESALAKNVATETKGWNDFLTRVTGKSDLETMTQPELHAVSESLEELKKAGRTGKEEQLVLPEGSNATRFTQEQYTAGVTAALLDTAAGKPVTLDEALKRVQTQKGVDSDQAAERLLRSAAGNDDLVIEKGTGFQAVSSTGKVLGTYASEAEARRNHRRVDIVPVETELVGPRVEESTEKVAQLPEGYEIKTKTVAGDTAPAAYVVRVEGSQKNESQTFGEEDQAKERLNALARSREASAKAQEAAADRIQKGLEKQQANIIQMETDGLAGTDKHTNAVNKLQADEVTEGEKIKALYDKAEELRQPLKIVPLGKKTTKVEKHTVTKNGKEIGTFTGDKGKTGRTKAEEHILSQASNEELQIIADRGGVFGKRAEIELDTRERPGVRGGTTEGLEKAGVRTPEVEAKLKELEAKLKPMLDKFGLGNVGLNVVRAIENDAEGAWGGLNNLIRIAFDAKTPIKTMRHEALHALFDLGFFTPQQWEALKRQAKKTWVNKYLKGVAFNETMSRFDAYTQMGLSNEAILEEAIADAFGDFEAAGKAPAGMLEALFKRMQQFFSALRQALTGAGFESADEIFGKIERGELRAGKEAAGTETKMSLSGIGVPMSTRNLMEVQTPVAQQELGLNTEAKRGRFNSVRQIATALNDFTKTNLGVMQAGDLTSSEATQIAKAIADEVGYQLKATAKTGTGKGWYSTNYPNAVKLLSNRFPELGTSQHARSVFSAIVAVTSNGEKVAKNIANAIKLYSKLRDGKQMVAMNNRRGTALVNNLRTIHKLLEEHGENFEKVLLKEITVKDMNAELKAMGEKTDNSYLANTTVPAAAVYFGPKLGAFYANLSGAEGYLTMDLWWTRSINRMRGLLMPQATEASINKFRDMIDRPEATRDEVIAATIPLRDKYKEYGYNTELEYLVGSKEPRTNDKRPAWFKQAEEKAGDAYEQLLFDHNAEKMANTIYKNEYEMLEEAPFNASDRKFMYDAARQAQNMLRKEGVDLSLADVQAALWYYEKRLYEKLSGRKADDIGYEEAIIEQSKQGTGRARPSVVFDREYGGGTESRRESGKADEVRGQPTGTQSEQGVSGEQKYSLGKNADRVSFVGPAFDERKLRGAGDRGRGSEVRNLAPLEGSPSVKGFSGPDPRLVSIAEQYAKDNGIDYRRQKEYVQVDEDRARRIADAYDKMEHAPQDPEVKEAYQNLIRQTRAQYDALVKNGYKFWFTDYNIPDNAEYLFSPWNAMRDIRANKTMGVFPTNEGFGTTEFDPAANPLLEDTGLEWPVGGPNSTKKSPVLANDLFRAVHDAFGHGLEGAGFRARGEENAWLAHSKLFTGSALAAITSETRGQNSWLNYGPQGEKNRTAKIEDTTFADQKTGLMPSWTWKEGQEKYSLKFAEPALKPKQGEGIVLGKKQPDAQTFVGLHYGQNKVDELSGSKYGSGIRGAERRRLQETDDQRIKKRIYFYIPKEDGSMPRNEAGLGGHVYTQQFDNIAAGPVVDRLFSEAKGDANQFESNVVDAGYDGYAMPNMGMMVILNHNTPVEYHGTMGELAQSDKKFSLRQVRDIFDRAEKISEPPGVESIRQQWIGGVSGIGNRDSMYDLYRVNGSKKYIQDVQDFIRDELGDDFKGYRLMSNDELEELETASMGSQFVSFTLSPEVAKAFKNLPAYADKTGMSVVEMDLTPEHVAMIGHPGELELVVDYGQGYNPSDIKVVEKYSLRAGTDTKEFKQWFGNSKIVDANNEAMVMYHGTRKDFSEFKPGLIFVSPNPMVANKFAANDMLYSPDKPGIEPGANVMPVYIKAENPFDYDNPKHVDALFEKIKNLFDKSSREAGKRAISQGRFTLIEDERFVDAIKELGHDGLYVEEFGEKNLAVFKPTQIKSATGNRGTFDATNPDIRFSLPTYFPTAEEAENAAYQKAPPSTPEFKRFFGASKAKEEGRPQVMYHGSLNEFDQFNEDNRKGLIFVTPSPAFAEEYALLHASRMEKQAEPPVKVYPLWVRAETPFDYENPVHVDKVMNSLGSVMSMNEYIQTEKEVKKGNWAKIEDPRFVATLKKLGFDSLYVNENRTKNLAVFSANQVKSITGNIGEFGENKDIRYSLRKFDRADLPTDKKPFTLPENTMIFHGAHKDAAQKIKDAGRVLLSYPGVKSSSGTLDEGGLIFFGDKETASNYANQKADPMSVKAAIDRGETRLPGTVFETVTDRPYRLMSRNHKLTKQQANALNEALGIPDYKQLSAGDDADLAATRAHTNSRVIKRENIPNKGEMTSPWPVIFKTLGFDGFYDNRNVPAVVLTADNGIKLIGDDGRLVKYSLPVFSAADEARVNETAQVREHKGVIARILDAFAPESLADLRASFIHRYNQFGYYDKLLAEKMGGKVLLADMSAEAAANMSDLSASVTYAAFGIGNRKGGIPVYKNGMTIVDTSTKGPLQILAPLAQFSDPKAYQHYQFWAGVKRGSRFLETGEEENYKASDIALAEKYRKAYMDKGVNFITIQKEMNTFNDGLVDYMVTTGVLSKGKAAEFKRHMDYIPFYRQLNGEDTVGPKIFNSISGVKPPKKIKHSEAPLTDYLESIVQNTQAAINAGMKNMAAQRAIGVAMQLGPIAGAQKLSAVSSKADCVTVLENGEAVSYRVADQLFINAMKNLNMVDMPWLGIFSAPSNVLRNLVTKDPGFMLANLARDSLSAWVTSGTNMTPVVGTVANFVAALGGKSPIYHALLNAGILGGYEFSSGIMRSAESFQKDLNKKYGSNKGALPLRAFNGVWEALEQGTEASDAATRMAVYERVLAETGNETEALYRALEVMNFNRKGSSPIARILTAAIPFLNARIQGLDVFYRTAMGQNVSANAKEMQRAFFVRGATLMALSAAYFLAVSDDDEWKKQEQETKDNYWIFPGVGKFPTPFEVGFLFKTVPERLMALTFKDDTSDDFKASMQRGLLNTFAFNPIPQVAKPIIEYNANYNFFTGRPIVGQGMEGLEAQYQIGPNTTKIAEVMGKALGMPPIKLDQLINSYTGTMGMYAMTVIDSVLDSQSNSPNASKRFEQLPIIKRFAADPEARGNITQFYELKKSVDAAVQTQNLLLKSGKAEEFAAFMEENKGLLAIKPYVANIESSMKQMREMRKMVQGAEMSGDEKRDTLTALGQAENNLTANIQTVKKMISEL